jgi:GNAT superfamily N-acetyltransferase
MLTMIGGIDDRRAEAVRKIVSSTGFFNPEEIGVAVELAEEARNKGVSSGYFFLFAQEAEEIVGYTCYGPISGTDRRYDLYWIAVEQQRQGRQFGRLLLEATESEIWKRGGRAIYAETSGRELYAPTRTFYARNGYLQEAVLEDFYADGDSKVIFVKRRPAEPASAQELRQE